MTDAAIKKSIGTVAREAGQVDKVILFGSRARGQARPDSDWDVLVLLHDPKLTITRQLNIMDRLYDLELEIEQPISTLIYTTADWEKRLFDTPLYNNVSEDGELL